MHRLHEKSSSDTSARPIPPIFNMARQLGHRRWLRLLMAATIPVGLVVSLVVGLVLYHSEKTFTGALIDCYPQEGASEEKCKERGCVWRGSKHGAGPRCIYPQDGHGYKMEGKPERREREWVAGLRRLDTPLFYRRPAFTHVTLNVTFESGDTLRLKFSPVVDRFEVPLKTDAYSANFSHDSSLYNITLVDEPQFGLKVTRVSTGSVVFDTCLPGLTLSDQYLEISTGLPSDNVYGFGEHNHRQLRHDMNWKQWTIFTRDVAPIDSWNLYGAHPVYMNLENDGNANGVFLKNSNAMDIVLQPSPFPAITFRTIGGVLDFYIFLGPTPENVVQQYTRVVGRPVMPPYWSLGFQISRWGYENISEIEEVLKRNREARIPQDVQYGDIDYMYNKLTFTYDKDTYTGLPDLVDKLHSQAMKYVVIIDPAIGANSTIIDAAKKNSPGYSALDDLIREAAYVKNANGGILYGEVWPGLAVYPDFTNNKSEVWLEQWLRYLFNNESVDADGLWIDMNEPSNFVNGATIGCSKNHLNCPPYVPNVLGKGDDGCLYDKTICMDSKQDWGLHYDVHSLYGHSQAISTYRALRRIRPQKRPFVLSRSTFAGTGKYAVHWLGDNQSRWPQMHWSIIGMLEFSLFGFSMSGADICGFWYDATEEMCLRWIQLGSFYPFSRNHNGLGFRAQDPASWGREFAVAASNVLLTRYKLLPYLYTLLHIAHISGSTVARPLFHEYPRDKNTWSVDAQFLWGAALMISPALTEAMNCTILMNFDNCNFSPLMYDRPYTMNVERNMNGIFTSSDRDLPQDQRKVEAYFPEGRWYSYYTGDEVKPTGSRHELPTPLSHINLHVRGGHILVWQQPDVNTNSSRSNPMGLLVALDSKNRANGSLFWDDGESYDTFNSGSYLFMEFVVYEFFEPIVPTSAHIPEETRAPGFSFLNQAKYQQLSMDVVHDGCPGAHALRFETIDILGLDRLPSEVIIDGIPLHPRHIRRDGMVVQLFRINLSLAENHKLTWSFY